MNRPTVCVLSEIPRLADIIRSRCSHLVSEVVRIDDASAQKYVLDQADVIVSEPSFAPHWIEGGPNLKLVQSTFAGVDAAMKHFQSDTYIPSFQFCRFGGMFGAPMSEYVLSQIIGFERAYKAMFRAQEKKQWSKEIQKYIWLNGRELNQLTLVILGLGDIGRVVAKVCKSFGMRIIGLVTQIPRDTKSYVDEYRTSDELKEVLSSADYVCNLLPSTPQTRGLLDSDTFKACSAKRSVFMNVGRGDICTEQSIINALDNGWLRGAILDVFEKEPLPSTSSLWNKDNVIISPHVSAVSQAESVADMVRTNIEHLLKNEPLDYKVDWIKGY